MKKLLNTIWTIYVITLGLNLVFTAAVAQAGLLLYTIGVTLIAIGLGTELYTGREEFVAWTRVQYNNVRDMIERLASFVRDLSWYSWGKAVFAVATALPILLIIGYFVPQTSDFIAQLIISREQPFSSNSLILMVNMIGFVFIISIFLIQNTTQTYSPNLSKEIFRDKYLVLIFIFLLTIAFYNLSALYFQLEQIYQLLSYILAVSSFFYLISLALVTAHFLDISNSIEKAEKRICSKITESNLYKSNPIAPLKDEEFIDELTSDTLLITNTGIVAIENNDHELVVSCIRSLEQIGEEYIGLLQDPTDDDFLTELNDQYEFLIQSSSREYTSQKYLEPLSEALGHLSRLTLLSTENKTQTSMWLRSLQNVFQQTYPEMDRTEALGKSISELNRTVVLSLNADLTSSNQHYWGYTHYIEKIGKLSLQNKALFPLRACIGAYRWHYISMVNSLISGGPYFQAHQVKKPLDDLAELYINAKKNGFDASLLDAVLFNLNSFTVLFRCYGLYSLTGNQAAAVHRISTSPPEEMELRPRESVDLPNARAEQEFIEYCEEFINFLTRMAKTCPGTNYHDPYSSFPEMLFVFSNDIDLEYVDDTILVEELTERFLNVMKKEIRQSNNGRPDSRVREYLFDYLIISLYFSRNDDELLSKVMSEFVDCYENGKHYHSKNDLRWLYRFLKFAGLILDSYSGLNRSEKVLEDVLVSDYFKPSDALSQGASQALMPAVAKLGYPTDMSHGVMKLSANQMWPQNFQPILEVEFYQDIGERMKEFNEYLESKQ